METRYRYRYFRDRRSGILLSLFYFLFFFFFRNPLVHLILYNYLGLELNFPFPYLIHTILLTAKSLQFLTNIHYDLILYLFNISIKYFWINTPLISSSQLIFLYSPEGTFALFLLLITFILTYKIQLNYFKCTTYLYIQMTNYKTKLITWLIVLSSTTSLCTQQHNLTMYTKLLQLHLKYFPLH